MRSSKIQTFGLLVVIIVGAFLLRSYSLPDRGIQFLDETIYYGQPASMATHIRWWMSGEGANLSVDQQRLSLMRAIEKVRGLPGGWLTDKPFYGLMAVIIYTLFGPSPSLFLIINAFLGATTAGLVYFLGRKLGQDKVAALFSAIALALSGFHMLWSRTGFTHVSATFFLTFVIRAHNLEQNQASQPLASRCRNLSRSRNGVTHRFISFRRSLFFHRGVSFNSAEKIPTRINKLSAARGWNRYRAHRPPYPYLVDRKYNLIFLPLALRGKPHFLFCWLISSQIGIEPPSKLRCFL